MSDPFKYSNYKNFLSQKIEDNRHIRGYRNMLAKAAKCHPSYLSQVVKGHVQLTPDHAAALADFWKLSQLQTDYFLLLLQKDRASHPALTKQLDRQIALLKKQNEDLSRRYEEPRVEESEVETLFFSSWYWAAITLAIGIPELENPQRIAERLRLPEGFVLSCLKQLEKMGLVFLSGDKWAPSNKSLHLPKDSILIHSHHSNWRHRALFDAMAGHQPSLHYTAIHSLSKRDYENVREVFLQAIDKSRQLAAESKEEDLIAVTCDVFRV